ncbi:MAG TPA: protein kinase [Candidatus Rifleibacterium sp.]|nr:protein kinase [Candidatus Rifleibacterium sp.]HPT44751.1 protein kinase [Candidatus Rifleibacterium sp.]
MIGEIINGKYKIEAAFSESHMYEVYSALEVATGTRVVVKILKEQMAAIPDRVRGFSDEIKSFASLSHPLIAEVLDVDMFDDRPFVVSPIVEGKDLHALIRENILPLNDCIAIIQDMATVLQYACDQKVEYRTIKLSNVLRRTDGRLSVLSFTHPRLKLAVKTSRSEGSGVHSDLYFLGSTFFELLAGESPIRQRGGINELWDMKLEKLLRIRHPEISPLQVGKIVEFVRRTLTRELDKRFNSHEEFLKSLADLSGTLRETNIRNRVKQMSMASQVVDALNGRMSNVNTSMPPVVAMPKPAAAPARAAIVSINRSADASADQQAPGFADTAIEGNLALVVDNSGKDGFDGPEATDEPMKNQSKRHLRLVKPAAADQADQPTAPANWQGNDEKHWLYNPVLFMGICLTAMVFLILFW